MGRRGFSLLQLLIVMVVITLIAGMLIPALAKARKSARKRDCVSNLKCIGTSLYIYVARFGSGRQYPQATGGAFWNALRTIPTSATSMLPDNDGLYVCKVKGTNPAPTAMDYRGPKALSQWPLDDRLTGANRAIASDRTSNHNASCDEDVNVILFDGHVESGAFGSQMWQKAATETQD